MAEKYVANSHTFDNSSVVPFMFDSHEIRTLTVDGEPYFVAKDMAEALGYSNTRDAISKHCKNQNSVAIRGGNRGNPNLTIIPESDVYRLITKSRLPEAERFERWVFEEVLPSIGRTGSYQHEQPEPSQPALTESTPADRRPLRDAVERWVRSRYNKVNNSHFREAWTEVNEFMQVESIKDIPREHIHLAVEYVEEQIESYDEPTPKALPVSPNTEILSDSVFNAIAKGAGADSAEACVDAAKLCLLRATYLTRGDAVRLLFYAYDCVGDVSDYLKGEGRHARRSDHA